MCIALVTFLPRSTNNLLQDSDTSQIIAEINKQHDPWRWFHHDWPLQNHFYRPIVAELFELEIRLHPHDDYKWGLTCDILAVITTLGLFWMLREVTDNPLVSTLSTGLFILWQVNSADRLSTLVCALSYAVLLVGLWRQRDPPRFFKRVDRQITALVRRSKAPMGKKILALCAIAFRSSGLVGRSLVVVLPAFLVWYWLGTYELHGFRPLGFRMLAWIPGRTASSMTAFAFLSLAAFARYMRLVPRRQAKATALDTPNTRSAEAPATKSPSAMWPLFSFVMLVGALLCYEQAVMIPPILGLIGLTWHFRGAIGRWWLWAIPYGGAVGAYLVLRYTYIPHTPTFYWQEQHRTTATAIRALLTYLVPFWAPLEEVWFLLTQSTSLFLTTLTPWIAVLDTAACATALWEVRRKWLMAGFGLLASSLSFAPMAWFKEFEHYHYWSMAFRAFFDVMMAWIALDLTVIAVSPRVRQSPRRRVPAPGSLPRP